MAPADSTVSRLAEEQAEQRRWRLRPRYARLHLFDQLVAQEFLPPEQQEARQSRMLEIMVRYAAQRIPYYSDVFGQRKLSPRDIRSAADLPLLPQMTRSDVQDRTKDLMTRQLPKSQQWGLWTRTSGTTGQPVRVRQTLFSQSIFHFLKQRELRWFRFDPSATLAGIRARDDLKQIARRKLSDGETVRIPSWPSAGIYFETGPFIGYAASNALEAQIEWLEANRPDYLIAQSAQLEHLALAFQDHPVPPSIRAIEAISQQLTPEMRRRIEASFKVPLHENYGLNEFGIVATRCPEGGRYHVHSEQCVVEIVDEDDKPCTPGKTGRILVSTLVNAGMPLLRYDADDLAEAVAGPCPCGRTLPAFGAITGRYRRIAALPPGTWDYWRALQKALIEMPPELARPLRQYQLHQFRDGTFELRLATRSSLQPAFMERIRAAWQTAAPGGESAAVLAVREMDAIAVKSGGKFRDFTSDFIPEPGTNGAGAG